MNINMLFSIVARSTLLSTSNNTTLTFKRYIYVRSNSSVSQSVILSLLVEPVTGLGRHPALYRNCQP